MYKRQVGVCRAQKISKVSVITKEDQCIDVGYKILVRPILTYASETWEKRYNLELYALYDIPNVITFIKLKRIEWAGHIIRVCGSRVIRKAFNAQPQGERKVGRQKLRWVDGVRHDISTLGIRNGVLRYSLSVFFVKARIVERCV